MWLCGRASARGATGWQIDQSRSSRCSTTGVMKVVVCAIMSCGMVRLKDPPTSSITKVC